MTFPRGSRGRRGTVPAPGSRPILEGAGATQRCLLPRASQLRIISFSDFLRVVEISNSYVKSGDFIILATDERFENNTVLARERLCVSPETGLRRGDWTVAAHGKCAKKAFSPFFRLYDRNEKFKL